MTVFSNESNQDNNLHLSNEEPEVTVIILNWNGWQDTIHCLESLYHITYSNFLTVVVDNGSTDNSIEMIQNWASGRSLPETYLTDTQSDDFIIECIVYNIEDAESGGVDDQEERLRQLPSDKRFVIISSPHNLGFSAGNNVGIRYAIARQSKYVLLLNNDTVVDEAFLEPLVTECESDVKTAIATGKIYYMDRPDTIWYGGGFISLIRGGSVHHKQGFVDAGQLNQLEKVGFASGCMMLVDASVLESVGLLDERFFLGGEDFALCWDIRKKGYEISYIHGSKIWHKVGASRQVLRPRDVYNSYMVKALFMKRVLNRKLWRLWFFLFSTYCRTIALYRLSKRLHGQSEVSSNIQDLRDTIKLALVHAKKKDSITIEDLETIDCMFENDGIEYK